MALIIRDSIIKTGSRLITNNDIINQYTGNIEDPRALLEKIGRDTRYFCNQFETTLTMGADVAAEVLKRNSLTGEDIDLIAFCSQFPEYTVPTQSLLVHNHIKGKAKCIVIDMNSNCLGMLSGLDIVNRYFKDKKGDIHRALLIGSDYMSKHTQKDNLITLGSLADGACALLLEYTPNKEHGIIGASSRTISIDAYNCSFPGLGLSTINPSDKESIKLYWEDPTPGIIAGAMKEALHDVLDKHKLKVDDIDWFCGSQYAETFFNSLGDTCEIPQEKRIYIGNKYGYTGTSSPFFSYTVGVNEGKIKKGDIVFFTTVGVGMSICSMLVRI